jgi:thiol-disulfide isomerase/thioredoxin
MSVRLILLLLAALTLAACGGRRAAPISTGAGTATIAADSQLLDDTGDAVPRQGDLAPDFAYTLADGTTHKLSDLRGKKVVVNFWATWCEPCRVEMPDLQKASQEYGDQVAILGVNWREEADVIQPFAEEFAVTFPLIANPTEDITRRYGMRFAPMSYFINTDGTIGYRQIGVMNYDFMKERLDQLK